MSPPKVAVVLPIYNSERYLAEAVRSVLAQTHADFELLVSDDDSRDGSVAVIRSFADARIRLIRNERGRGIFQNLNTLCSKAASPYIKIMCADDVLAPACLERQLAFMESNPALGYSYCYERDELGPPGTLPPKRYKPELPDVIAPEAAALTFFTFGNLPGYLSKLILRRSLYEQVGPFREDLPYAADFEYWARAAERAPMAVLREELVHIRYHPDQASATLNRRNELSPQMTVVVNAIRSRVGRPELARILTWHGTMLYAVQQIHWAVRACARGDLSALARLRGRRNFSYPLPVAFLLYVLSLNGRVGRGASTRRLLQLCQAACPARPVFR